MLIREPWFLKKISQTITRTIPSDDLSWTRFRYHRYLPSTISPSFRRRSLMDNEFPSFRSAAEPNERMGRRESERPACSDKREKEKKRRKREERGRSGRNQRWTTRTHDLHDTHTHIRWSSERDRGGPSSYCNAEVSIPLHYRTVRDSSRALHSAALPRACFPAWNDRYIHGRDTNVSPCPFARRKGTDIYIQ